ncbi:MAG: hypothetical protein R3F34_11215 [Planctomycetota bacterium]
MRSLLRLALTSLPSIVLLGHPTYAQDTVVADGLATIEVAPPDFEGRGLGNFTAFDGDRAAVACSLGDRVFLYDVSSTGDMTLDAEIVGSAAGFAAGVQPLDLDGDRLAVRSDQGVHVLERQVGGAWSEVAVVHPSPIGPGPLDCRGISLDGDTLLVGVRFSNNTAAVHVFERDAFGTWNEVDIWFQTFGAVSPIASFGERTDLDGDVAVVADRWNASTLGVGLAFVHERDSNGQWNEVAVLGSSFAGPGGTTTQNFAESVSVHGDRLAVGGTLRSGPLGLANSLVMGGAVRLYERQSGGGWAADGVVVRTWAPGTAVFGTSVDLDGDDLIVSGSGSNATSFGPITSSDADGAFTYTRTGPATWDPVDQLAGHDFEGPSVALRGDIALCSRAASAFGVANAGVVASYSLSTGNWNRVDVETDPVASGGISLLDLRDGDSESTRRARNHLRRVRAPEPRRRPGRSASMNRGYGSATVIPIAESDPFVSQPTSISIDGDRIVLGAATQDDKVRPDHTRGRAYVLERDAFGQWAQVAALEDAVPDFTNPITGDTPSSPRACSSTAIVSRSAARRRPRRPGASTFLKGTRSERGSSSTSSWNPSAPPSPVSRTTSPSRATRSSSLHRTTRRRGARSSGAVHVVERQTNRTWIPVRTIEDGTDLHDAEARSGQSPSGACVGGRTVHRRLPAPRASSLRPPSQAASTSFARIRSESGSSSTAGRRRAGVAKGSSASRWTSTGTRCS